MGKPLLLIPSPNVTANHQFHNAAALVKEEAALLIEENELDEKFRAQFSNWVSNSAQQQKMQANLKALSKPEATQTIINEIQQLL